MRRRRLEDVLPVRAHVSACARHLDPSATLERVGDEIYNLVPGFLLRDEKNQKVWAEVISAHTGLNPDDLVGVYREYLAREEAREEEIRHAPLEARVFYRQSRSSDWLSFEPGTTNPARLAWICASLEEGGGEVCFRVYGRGKLIKGRSVGWWIGCSCGRWICARHGEPRRLPPSCLFDNWDGVLWPYVPIVRGSRRWHEAPPPPRLGKRRPSP
jgi:hypothetical protein